LPQWAPGDRWLIALHWLPIWYLRPWAQEE